MNFFKRKQKKAQEKTILQKIQAHPVCKPMNDLEFNENGVAWLNPSNQLCFNFGWFTEEDFKDWLEGKGKIVKGKNDEEKQKMWHYAHFEKENKYAYLIAMHYKHFDKVNTDYKILTQPAFHLNAAARNPIDYKNESSEEIIKKVFSHHLNYLLHDMQHIITKRRFEETLERLFDEYGKIFYGVKTTLLSFDIGYIGAVNTPDEIKNLSWYSDVVLSKAYYLYLESQGVEMPDMDFVLSYRYKNDN